MCSFVKWAAIEHVDTSICQTDRFPFDIHTQLVKRKKQKSKEINMMRERSIDFLRSSEINCFNFHYFFFHFLYLFCFIFKIQKKKKK